MKNWKWTTFLLFFLIAIISTMLIKCSKKGIYFDDNSSRGKSGYNTIFYIGLAYVVLIIFCLIRNVEIYPPYPGEHSIDMNAYIYFFQNNLTAGWDWKKILTFNQWEPLFYTVNIIIRAFTDNYRIYWFVLYSFYLLCMLLFLFETIDGNMETVILPYFIVGLLYGMCALRSCIANAWCLLAFLNLQKNKKKKFVLYVLIATLFHYTAIVVLPLVVVIYVSKKLKSNERERCCIFVIMAFAMVFVTLPIGKYIISQTKYAVYLGNRMTLIGQAPLFCCAVMTLLFFNDIKHKYMNMMVYIYIVLYNFLMIPFIVEFNVSRISDFFLLPRLIVWTMILGCIKDRVKGIAGKRAISILAFGIMMLWMMKTIYDMKEYGIMPYLCSLI